MKHPDFDCQCAGFRMPGEWEPMAATWLGSPVLHKRAKLWDEHCDAVCRAFALRARTGARYQRCIVAAHAPRAAQAREWCGPAVTVLPLAVDDNWLRDCGPMFLVIDDQLSQAALGFRFNAWGEKGPIDGIASFIEPGRILFYAADADMGDCYRSMQENRRALQLATDARGRSFELIDLPVPCDARSDGSARQVFAHAFPGRVVELLPAAAAISIGGGAMHCSTQQQPMLGKRLRVGALSH